MINSGTHQWQDEWECGDKQELDARCDYLDRVFMDIKRNGYRSQVELNERRRGIGLRYREDEIAVNIGRQGDLLFNSGRHRLTFAKIAGIPRIPVKISVRHTEWEKFKAVKFELKTKNAIDGRTGQVKTRNGKPVLVKTNILKDSSGKVIEAKPFRVETK